MIDPLSIQGLWPVLKRLPTFATWFTKWYFTPQRLSQLIYVDLFPRNESARFNLGRAASFDIHLQLINLSPFELELEVAEIQVQCGGPTLKASIHKKQKIAPGAITVLHLWDSINDGQADEISKNYKNNQVSLHGNIEFKCRLRSFAKVITTLSGIQATFVNENSREIQH